MTVRELIDELSDLPEDTEVLFSAYSQNFYIDTADYKESCNRVILLAEED